MNSLPAEQVRGLIADTISFSNVDGPGNRFVVFLQGCNFDCIACHNPQTIPGQRSDDVDAPQRRTVGDIVGEIRRAAPFISGVTVSGGEATRQPRFVRALFTALRDDPALRHLTRFVDSNGACDLELWDRLLDDGLMDAAMIDLKCLDPATHEQITGRPNDQVLASIAHLADRGALHEVRLLLMSGLNDDPGLLSRTGRWLAEIDPTMRIKIIGFHEHGTRPHDPPIVEPGDEQLAHAAELLDAEGDFEITVVGSSPLVTCPA